MIEGTEYEKILNMTDEQAADILEKTCLYVYGGRGNGKTLLKSAYEVAINKAIKKLRGEDNGDTMPYEFDKFRVCAELARQHPEYEKAGWSTQRAILKRILDEEIPEEVEE